MTKLAEGKLDLHSKRGAVDPAALGERIALAGGARSLVEAVRSANSALHAFELAQAAGFDLPALVANGAWATAARVLAGQSGVPLESLYVSSADLGEVVQAQGLSLAGRLGGEVFHDPVLPEDPVPVRRVILRNPTGLACLIDIVGIAETVLRQDTKVDVKTSMPLGRVTNLLT